MGSRSRSPTRCVSSGGCGRAPAAVEADTSPTKQLQGAGTKLSFSFAKKVEAKKEVKPAAAGFLDMKAVDGSGERGGRPAVLQIRCKNPLEVPAPQPLRVDNAGAVAAEAEPAAQLERQLRLMLPERSRRLMVEKHLPEPTKKMYERVRVEDFGLALLRGMGFDPKKHSTEPVFNSTPREGRLGIGARPVFPEDVARALSKEETRADAPPAH